MRHREGERPIPNYKLESFLGEGGYGEVWKAIGPGGVPCALKFIKLDSNAGLKELKSIGLVKRLRHPNLVPLNAVWLMDTEGNLITEGGDETASLSFRVYGDKELVIAMGLGSGSLADRLNGARAEKAADALPGGLSLRRLLEYMRDAARGIDCLNDPPAHDNPGILPLVHCDIKPANLLLVGGGVQVCDYGVAKAVGKDIKKTLAAGTAAYAPPELINNDPGLKTDQYSLAISYYELRTGALPLDENRAMMAHLMGMLDFGRVPTDEREVLQQATAMKVGERFDTCAEFVEALYIATGRTLAGGSGPHSSKVGRGGSGASLSGPDTADDLDLPPPAPPPPPRPTSDVLRPDGSPVAGYTLAKMLGQGGYGQVWQALDPDGVPCALKILRDVTGKGRHEYETLVRLRRLDHPNLLRIEQLWVLDEFWAPIPAEQIGRTGGREARRMVIRTPLADKNLFQKLTECRRHSQPGIPPADLLKYLRQAADALDYLNIGQQIQHRDVKPENLLLKGETLWVCDFGLAKVVPLGSVTAQSTSGGMTQEYASPEVLTEKEVTERSDQYSLAVTYHVLRTGRLPFPDGLSMLNLIKARATANLDLGDVTERERLVLRRALSVNTVDRYPTCRDLMRELAESLDLSTSHLLAPKGPPAPVKSSGSTPVLLAPTVPPPARRPASAHGTIEFPTTETSVRFEADPIEPARTAEWAAANHTRTARPARHSGFVEDKPEGGNKLLLGGLAALAAAGLGIGVYFALPGGPPDTAGGGTSPTSSTTLGGETTPPTDKGNEKKGAGTGTAPTPDKPPPPPPPPPPPADDAVMAPVRARIAANDWPAARRLLDDLPRNASSPVQEWAREWRTVLDAPAPTPADAGGLVRYAAQMTPTSSSLPHADELEAAKRSLVARYAAKAVPGFGDGTDWPAVKRALLRADPSEPWVAGGLAEAQMELREPASVPANLPDGFGGYLRAVSGLMAGDELAAAVPVSKPEWATPYRAGRLLGAVEKAITDARGGGPSGPYPPDKTALVAKWLLAADRSAVWAGEPGNAVRDRLAADVVYLSFTRGELKPLAADAERRLPAAAPSHFSKEAWEKVTDARKPALAAAKALRREFEAARGSPEAFAKLLPRLTEAAKQPDAAAKPVVAEVLSDAGRLLFRNRDRWAGKPGFGTAKTILTDASQQFAAAARLSNRPTDAAWRGIAEYYADLPPTVPPPPEAGSAGLVLAALIDTRGLGAKPKDEQLAARERALKKFREAIQQARGDDAATDELALAYSSAANHAVVLANSKTPPTEEGRGLLDRAIGWGDALAELERDRAEGPNRAGCAWEDVGWLFREPGDRAERCRDGVARAHPYASAEAHFAKAAERPYGEKGYALLHRGRNLYKWAEDQAQLVRWRGQGVPAAPPEPRLKEAEKYLQAAYQANPSLTPEAQYWLAEAATLRYEAAASRTTDDDPTPLASAAVAAHQQVGQQSGFDKAAWQAASRERLAELRAAESRRLIGAERDQVRQLIAGGKPAEAAKLAAAIVQQGEKSGLTDAERAADFATLGRAHMLAGADGDAAKNVHWPKAATAFRAALPLAPAATDRWYWRYSIGRVELWGGQREEAANRLGPAADQYALACNQLLEAFHLVKVLGRADPTVFAEYAKVSDDLVSGLKTVFSFYEANKPEGEPATTAQAVRRLSYVDLLLNQKNEAQLNDRKSWADLRQRADGLMTAVVQLKRPGDEQLVKTAEEFIARIRRYGLPGN